MILLPMIFAFCFLAELITANLFHIGGIFYDSLWYQLPAKQQRIVIFPIQRGGRGFRFRSLGLIDCSLATFLSVFFNYFSKICKLCSLKMFFFSNLLLLLAWFQLIRTAWSYFVIIRRLQWIYFLILISQWTWNSCWAKKIHRSLGQSWLQVNIRRQEDPRSQCMFLIKFTGIARPQFSMHILYSCS